MTSLRRIAIVAISVVVLGLATVVLAAITGPARAQEGKPGMMRVQVLCMPYDQLKFDLAGAYGEAQAFVGVTPTGGALTIFVSRDGSWTAAIMRNGAPVCIFIAGKGWSWRPPKEPAS